MNTLVLANSLSQPQYFTIGDHRVKEVPEIKYLEVTSKTDSNITVVMQLRSQVTKKTFFSNLNLFLSNYNKPILTFKSELKF